MPSNHLILYRPLLLPSVFPSIRVFSNESALHQVAKGLELQLQHQSFQCILRVDFLQDWPVWSPCSPRDSQESSPSPQSESINSLALNLLNVQLSHLHMTTGKSIALTIWTFVSKMMSLLFNMLSVHHSFSSKGHASFNLITAVTIHSDFGDQENKIWMNAKDKIIIWSGCNSEYIDAIYAIQQL